MPHSDRLILDQLRQLVGTPSVSSTDPTWDQGNREVIDLLATWLTDMGFRTEIVDVVADGIPVAEVGEELVESRTRGRHRSSRSAKREVSFSTSCRS